MIKDGMAKEILDIIIVDMNLKMGQDILKNLIGMEN